MSECYEPFVLSLARSRAYHDFVKRAPSTGWSHDARREAYYAALYGKKIEIEIASLRQASVRMIIRNRWSHSAHCFIRNIKPKPLYTRLCVCARSHGSKAAKVAAIAGR